MDATETNAVLTPFPSSAALRVFDPERRAALILDALRFAITHPKEHRLFQSGKLPGLFTSRLGPAADAALFAIKDGLLETVRTEMKGRLVVEWVRTTPKAIEFVHAHDSPKAVLQDLRDTIGTTRAGLPVWMADMRDEFAGLAAKFEERTRELNTKLDELTRRVEAAIRRTEVGNRPIADGLSQMVPWGVAALEYLDRRQTVSHRPDCPLAELFHSLRRAMPNITVPEFHDGLRRLHENRALQLIGRSTDIGERSDPEYALIVGSELCHFVRR
jgi:hypothetical protein